jgi:hypothetical protein
MARGARHTAGTFDFDIPVCRAFRSKKVACATKSELEGGLTMTYRVYSGPRGSESMSPLDKESYLYKEFNLLDEAMNWARHINDGGRVALLIEGDDGTRLTKQQIVTALRSPDTGVAAEHAA